MLAGALWPVGARAELVPPTPPTAPAAATPATDLEDAASRTLTDLYRRMTAPVLVNGQGPFPFVVDTGANRTVISAELANRLSLVRGAAEPVNGAAGVQMAPTVMASLGVAGRRPARTILSVLPAESLGGLGMLGVDRLRGQRVTLDFQDQELRIEGSGRAAQSPEDIVVPAHRRDGQLTLVDAELAGMTITAFVDSGTQTSIGNPTLLRMARARYPSAVWTTASIISATGQVIAADVADLPALRLGGLTLKSLPVAFADLHTFHLWPVGERPALLIGIDVLRLFEYVSLDFGRSEVRFRVPAQPA
jgi:predicted aspartyl protease